MRVSRLRILCTEVYETIMSLNPSLMNNVFKVKIPQIF